METVHGRAEGDGFTLVTDEDDDGELVARVSGTLDASHGPQLHQALLGALRQAPTRLVVDLSGVEYFGSAGVTALVWLSQHPEAAGKHVRVVATSRIVTGPLELTGLLQRLDVTGMPAESRPPTDPTGPAVPPSA
ncbi:anti-sigma B factor antagonist [Klenkia soli]|uniref:Anti-sigma factor antagonist n=1 Tax=Klenkia soli TaxID=1052260 RepID=A0A1H0R2S6_9ACTN|nr:STAS domain-containing protein [Klenkia soli]SDP23720.1 anti-sigma B factor antagonist [Klenkia soli]